MKRQVDGKLQKICDYGYSDGCKNKNSMNGYILEVPKGV